MKSLFSVLSSDKFRSVILYTFMSVGLVLILVTLIFLIYRSQATAELSELNYDITITNNNSQDTTLNLTPTGNIVTVTSTDLTEVKDPILNTKVNSPSQYKMFPSDMTFSNWDLSLDKDDLIIPQDNIDLEYYDKWTSFYLDKKFLVDGISKLNKLYIPSISLESALDGLEINDVGDSSKYETPNKVVGYIPSTIESDKKNIWFFGHLESPLYGEGSIFKKLPEIPDLLRSGEDVFVYFDDEYFMYKYKIVSSKVVHEDELTLYDSDSYSLTLVTCVPKWVYDHRLVLTGELYSYAVK